MYQSLGEFIAALESQGELRRVRVPVSSMLEIAEISNRMASRPAPHTGLTGPQSDPFHDGRGGVALLFENVTDVGGGDGGGGGRGGATPGIPVAINLFGSYHRMELALGCHAKGHTPGGFDAIAERLAELTRPVPPQGLLDLISRGRRMLPLLRAGPKLVRRGACQEVVHIGSAINLSSLPIIKCWPLDGDPAAVGFPAPIDQPDTGVGAGRFITFAGMHTIHVDDVGVRRPASRNVGMYRAQVIDRRRLAMHWHIHHDGARHWRSWKRLGKPMPIAIVLGGESVLPYAATAPLPPGLSELLLAGFLNRGPIPLVRGITVPLDVPASAEIVIEGFVSTEAGFPDFDPRTPGYDRLGPGAVLEGPFGDHTGFYSLPDRYPIMEVTAITQRRQPIYLTTIVGPPPQEDYYMGKATERVFHPLLKTLIPDIYDYDLPIFGCFHNCAFVSIAKEYALQARRVMHAIWGAGQMSWTKVIVVVDADVNVHDHEAVWQAVFANCRWDRDIEMVRGPLDILDHAAPYLGAGSKMGFDASRRMTGEGTTDSPPQSQADIEVARRIAASIPGVAGVELPSFARGRAAFISVHTTRPHHGREAISNLLNRPDWPCDFVIAVGRDIDLRDSNEVLFRWCANFDVGRDMIRQGQRLGFDATPRTAEDSGPWGPVRDFPPHIEMSEEIRERVTRRWRDYGLDD